MFFSHDENYWFSGWANRYVGWNGNTELGTSASCLAEIWVRSPRKILLFIFWCLKKYFLNKSTQKTFHLILKTEALLGTQVCIGEGSNGWPPPFPVSWERMPCGCSDSWRWSERCLWRMDRCAAFIVQYCHVQADSLGSHLLSSFRNTRLNTGEMTCIKTKRTVGICPDYKKTGLTLAGVTRYYCTMNALCSVWLCIWPRIDERYISVLSFLKSNKMFFGYFHPDFIFCR